MGLYGTEYNLLNQLWGHTYSFTSLHSDANDADMVNYVWGFVRLSKREGRRGVGGVVMEHEVECVVCATLLWRCCDVLPVPCRAVMCCVLRATYGHYYY